MILRTSEELENLQALCVIWGAQVTLHPDEPEGAPLLYTFFLNERYTDANPVPRLEKGYCPGGRYHTPALWGRYGEASAKSYSNFQIMFPTAVELGYVGDPETLDDDAQAIQWVVALLNRRLIRLSRKDDEFASLEELLDAYNSGNPRDANVPHKYIARGTRHYAEALRVFSQRTV